MRFALFKLGCILLIKSNDVESFVIKNQTPVLGGSKSEFNGLSAPFGHSRGHNPRIRRSTENSQNNDTRATMIEAVNFMKKFGYLPEGTDEADFIFSPDILEKRLKVVQKFGAIAQTGKLDEETIQLMGKSRCGVPDLDPDEISNRRKRYVVGASGWNKRNLTYTVANWSPKLKSKSNMQTELRRAFDHWTRYSRLTFNEVQGNEADIVIFFGTYNHGDRYPFDGKGGILAHAYYPYDFDHFGGDIHFDDSEDWLFRAKPGDEGLDFFTVAVHEIGHSLGLAHSPVRSSIMFPYYKGVEENFALDYDDVMGMWELYIKRVLDGDEEYFKRLQTTTETSAGGGTQNDDEVVIYHGDSNTVDEHEARKRGEKTPPKLPPIPPPRDDDDYYEKERRRRQEERRQYEERRKEEEKRRQEEERRREEELEKKRRDDKRRREKEEKERRIWEEEQKRREEEYLRRREEERIKRERATTTTSKPVISNPDICSGGFDAAAMIRSEIFIFKDKYMWRFREKGSLMAGFPALVSSMFGDLPEDLQIDAVYERRNDSVILFFSGNHFYEHDGNRLLSTEPRPVSALGISIPPSSTVDAVFYWPKNDKTYIFTGGVYWRRDDHADSMEEGYPKDIARWNGIPSHVDAALTDVQGLTTFFKGSQRWKFDNYHVKPTSDSPSSDLREWTGCRS